MIGVGKGGAEKCWSEVAKNQSRFDTGLLRSAFSTIPPSIKPHKISDIRILSCFQELAYRPTNNFFYSYTYMYNYNRDFIYFIEDFIDMNSTSAATQSHPDLRRCRRKHGAVLVLGNPRFQIHEY